MDLILILVLHELDCNRDFHPCTCGMYGVNEDNMQCLGTFKLSDHEISEMFINDSIGGC